MTVVPVVAAMMMTVVTAAPLATAVARPSFFQ